MDQSIHPLERRKKLDSLLAKIDKPNSMDGLTPEANPELKALLENAEESRSAFLALGKNIQVPGTHTGEIVHRESLIPALAAGLLEHQQFEKEVVAIETRTLAQEPHEVNRIRSSLTVLILTGFAFNCACSLALVYFFTRDIRNRLAVVTEKGHSLCLGQPLPPPQSNATDEIADVDRVLCEAGQALQEIFWRESAVLDNAADMICSLSESFRFDTVGASSIAVWGYHPEELLGRSIFSLIEPEMIEPMRDFLNRLMPGGDGKPDRKRSDMLDNNSEGKFETLVRAPDGTIRSSLFTVTYSSDKHAFFCVVNDTTEIRSVEALKKRFLAMASHDLRTPMTSIGIILSTLTSGRKGDLPEAARSELQRALANCQRLTALVNDFLELEKLETNKFNLDLGPVCASEVINAAKETLSGLAKGANVLVLSPKNDAILLGDENRLVQVITNLMSNAIKFSPSGSTVETAIESRDNMARIEVKDSGPGISADDQKLLFSKFQQTQAGAASGHKGTGLGLAIVKNIVEAHDGAVGVNSKIGEGSTFWVDLPLFPDDESEELP